MTVVFRDEAISDLDDIAQYIAHTALRRPLGSSAAFIA
jgi:hypothetical protein